jgi:uncharacterized protein YuzE
MVTTRYDLNADALYLRLLTTEVARTEQIDEGTLVDLSATGELIGIEVLRPGRIWPLSEILTRYQVAEADANLLRAMFPSTFATALGEQRLAAYQSPEHQFSGGNRVALAS